MPSVRTLAVRVSLLGTLTAQGLAAEVHFVPAEFPTIQDAVAAASDFDVIVVSPGTWSGPLDTGGLDLEIRGLESAEATILDGLGASAVLQAGVPGEDSILSLVGFTITGGADGVVALGDGRIDLTNSIVRDNTGVGARGAVSATGCTFEGNGSHGMHEVDSARHCLFVGNGGWGLHDLMNVAGFQGGPKVEFCSFLGNGQGGARIGVSSSSGTFPGEIHVTSCLFVNDDLQVHANQAFGVGVTFVRNVTLDGGAIRLMQGALDVTSSILLSPMPIVDLSTTGSPSVTYSDVPGEWPPGTGNIHADPLWADAENGDYELVPGSPCINSGNPAWFDVDGSPGEMGAFGYDPWIELGGGIPPGGLTTPSLAGTGGLIAGEPMGFKLFPFPPSGVWVIASLQEVGAPFKGGILWPQPDIVYGPVIPLFGNTISGGPWPAGLPAGFSFVVQVWWPSAGAVAGWAASNGLRGVQP